MAEGTNIPTHTISCVSALKHFFGDHPNGTTRFVSEVSALTPEDKLDLSAQLRELGYNVPEKAHA